MGSKSALADNPGPGLSAGTYLVEEVGVLIEEKTAKGNAWDRPASPPDPAIELQVDGKTIADCKHQDSFEVRCEFEERVEIGKDTEVTLLVVDADIASDDPVGRARLRGLTESGQPGTKIAMEVEGQLTAAHVQLREAPSTISLYKSRFIGLAIGIALGLLLLFAFKDFWFREAPKKPAKQQETEA